MSNEGISEDDVLACIPDETSEGLPADDLRAACTAAGHVFNDRDFERALQHLLDDGLIRTTSKRFSGARIALYRRSSR